MSVSTPDNRTRKVVIVCGQTLLTRMTQKCFDESQLARAAGVSEQTVRNYVSSSQESPWPADARSFQKVCKAIGALPEELQLALAASQTLEPQRAIVADQRFLGDPEKVRNIAGKWLATSEDLEVPGYLTYRQPIPWHGTITIEQHGNQFEAYGEDKDGDGVLATGVLLECGNFLRFNYWIDNPMLREYGTAMVEYKGDGKTMEGIFLGRDAGHSSIGLVLARITLLRADNLTHKTQN